MKKIFLYILISFCVSNIYAQENVTKLDLESPIHSNIGDAVRMPLNLSDMRMESMKYHTLKTMSLTDYLETMSNPIEDDLYYSLYSSYEANLGLSNKWKAGGEVAARINKSFLVQAGFYAMKYDYNFGNRPYYDGVAYLSISYNINSWLSIGAFGQYSVGEQYNMNHGAIMPSPFVPHSAYGVSATAMFNKTFGVAGSVGQEFDPFTGGWHFRYGIAPVINLNSLFK